jgi:hypothetical protein
MTHAPHVLGGAMSAVRSGNVWWTRTGREKKEKRFFARLGICIFATSDFP